MQEEEIQREIQRGHKEREDIHMRGQARHNEHRRDNRCVHGDIHRKCGLLLRERLAVVVEKVHHEQAESEYSDGVEADDVCQSNERQHVDCAVKEREVDREDTLNADQERSEETNSGGKLMAAACGGTVVIFSLL